DAAPGPATGEPAVAQASSAAPAAPPAWPPVPEPFPAQPAEAPAVPESLASSLDMTAEIPKVRDGWEPAEAATGGVNGESTRRFADETMELPIFRELESAWFRTRATPPTGEPAAEPPARPAPAPVPEPPTEPVYSGQPYDHATAAYVPAEVVPAAAEVSSPEPELVEATTGSGGWQTAADDGWRAAAAL